MNSIVLVIVGALVLILGYRLYGCFIAAKVLALDETRKVPSEVFEDGKDYVPTNKWVLLGHHFAAIAGAGPLIGPVLAAQFGYLPGTLWILIGSVAAGAVHDMIMLFASVRFNGESIAEIAKHTLGKKIGFITSISVIFILIITMAGLGLPVVNSLYNSPWGTFTVGATIPIAIFVGIYLRYIRPGKICEATIIGMVLILLAVIFGPQVQGTALGNFLTLNTKQLSVILVIYGFCAAALPVWLLLLPRDYLSTYMKLGVIGILVVGILIVRPQLQMPALTQYIHGGGPVVSGKVFPFLFITIACGALSGFHSLISTGTSDYFAINSLPEVFNKLNLIPKDLPMLQTLVGEQLAGRPGGSVSLAVGMTYVFHNIPGLSSIMSYWYHFCIMFEALFILTTIDSGTRIGRYLLQDIFGKMYKPLANKDSKFNLIFFSALMSVTWGALLYSGNISTIWPLFGVANQTLAAIAFAIGTSVLIEIGKKKYTPITILPMIFIAITTMTASIENIFGNYIPNGKTTLTILSFIIMIMLVVIVVECVKSWWKNWNKNFDSELLNTSNSII